MSGTRCFDKDKCSRRARGLVTAVDVDGGGSVAAIRCWEAFPPGAVVFRLLEGLAIYSPGLGGL